MSSTRLSSESRAELEARIAEREELGPFAETILGLAMECAHLRTTKPDDYSAVGNSRYGGEPDLPSPDFWPKNEEGRCLEFLMQVNLAELPPLAENPLPASGMLYFFLELMEPAVDIACRVLSYTGDISELRRAEPPGEMVEEAGDELNPYRLAALKRIDLPERVDEFANAGVNDFYQSLREDLEGNDPAMYPDSAGKLLGYPITLTGDPRENAFLVRNRKADRVFDYAFREKMKEALTEAASHWRLLWRLDSNREVGILIWDAGSIQVIVHEAYLSIGDWNGMYAEVFST